MERVLQTVLQQIDHLLRHPHGLLQQHLHLLTLKTTQKRVYHIKKLMNNVSRKLNKLYKKHKKKILTPKVPSVFLGRLLRSLAACLSA
jgi:hypothetical protein